MLLDRVVRWIGLSAAAASAIALLSAQEYFWGPKAPPAKYVAPHRPHTKLADLKKKHAGKAEWRELLVDDEHLYGEYIQAAPGSKQPKCLHPDTRAWWVMLDGQIRFEIEGEEPFVATKGSMVQVPLQTYFSFETVGDKPSLRFEVNIAGAKTLYPAEAERPAAIPGINWMKVRMPRRPGVYDYNNKAHTTFAELAQALDAGRLRGTQRVVEDARAAVNFIYGYEKNLPPLNPNDKGHFHPEGAELWVIMAGQIRYPIEGQGVIIADEGDLVYVPRNTFHAPRWYGPGPSCRLAMNGFPNMSHLFEAH